MPTICTFLCTEMLNDIIITNIASRNLDCSIENKSRRKKLCLIMKDMAKPSAIFIFVFCLGKRDPLNLLASQGKRCLAIKIKKYFTNIIECQVMILFGLLQFRSWQNLGTILRYYFLSLFFKILPCGFFLIGWKCTF